MAGCRGCGGKPWSKRAQREGSIAPDIGNVGYILQEYEECSDLWEGDPFDLYFVGRGTPEEALFPSDQFAEAAVHARTHGRHLFLANARQFCTFAIEELLSGETEDG